MDLSWAVGYKNLPKKTPRPEALRLLSLLFLLHLPPSSFLPFFPSLTGYKVNTEILADNLDYANMDHIPRQAEQESGRNLGLWECGDAEISN